MTDGAPAGGERPVPASDGGEQRIPASDGDERPVPASDGGAVEDPDVGDAEYVFRVELQLSPETPDVRTEPAGIEAMLFKRAPTPGEEGWLFFRDNLWRGEVGDHDHLCRLAEESLDVPVRSIEFRELRTDETYREALETEIAADLAQFNADDVAEVLTKYLGSGIHVRER